MGQERERLDETELKWPWWVTGDCCGLVCAFVTGILHFFAYYVQMKYVIGPWFGVFSYAGIGYTCIMMLAVVSHSLCRFTNPGTVPLYLVAPKPLDQSVQREFVCKRSGVIKPPTSHWCSEAQRVVVKMDHYCPWVNNVVGMFTQKYFLLFLYYTFLCCLFSGFTLGARAFMCSRRSRHQIPFQGGASLCNPAPLDVILSVINFVEAVLFVLFTGCMGADQFEAISKNTPYIDRLQGKRGKARPLLENLRDVFGEPFSWKWFLPLPPPQQQRQQFNKMCYDTYDHLVKCAKAFQKEAEQAVEVDGEAIASNQQAQARRRRGGSATIAGPHSGYAYSKGYTYSNGAT
uniref:Palmitoyltransferase n=2 Tax=Lotharella globosa TaxID=91324 RepID=A0A6U3ANU8_9EUKA|mmetsp:Transcript_8511/g.16487  ORF Transcript_8511/g.16487 Transcript_8511/m.16487 type:complete len:346 (+) Transcript_8511:32-1069(+)